MTRTLKGLQVRYIRGARRVDIVDPDPNMVEVAGANGAGKSSVLDSVEWGIRGKKALPVDVLHHGATKGHTRVDLGDLVIERRVNENNAARGGTLKVTAADGSKWGEKDISKIWGAWTFDPLAFAQLSAEEQVQRIRALAGEGFRAKLASLERAIAEAREQRTEAHREVKRFGRIADVPEVEPVDAGALLAELERAQEHNEAQQRRVDQREAHERQLVDVGAKLAELEGMLEVLRRKRDALIDQELPTVEPFKELRPLQQKLAEASKVNEQAAAWKRAEAERAKMSAAVRLHCDLEAKVKDLEEERSQHLRTAQLPMEGLSWEGGHITLNGVPFKGLSTTEQLLLSARIGMAMTPDLRVMLIREGGLVDGERFIALRDLAAREGYQIIMETAGNGHTADALVIEDGELTDAIAEAQREQDDWGE
jgi:hypothetical protein